MSEKIKQVAKAIRSGMESSGVVSLVANGPKGEAALQQFFEVLAMDAVEAMREPTQQMRLAGIAEWATPDPTPEHESTLVFNAIWRAMIDAALAKTPA
jgi:hypothetical protein